MYFQNFHVEKHRLVHIFIRLLSRKVVPRTYTSFDSIFNVSVLLESKADIM